MEPCKVKIQLGRVKIHLSITSFQVVVPIVVDSINNWQDEQINGQTPHNDVITNEPIFEGPQEIELRRSVRSRRSTISDECVVYLHSQNLT